MWREPIIRLLLALLPLAAFAADPALTIYNQNFAVVRETIPLELTEGVNAVKFTDITVHLEPDSVILRDPSGKTQLQIIEQNFRNDPVTQQMMLYLFEGREIDFLVKESQKRSHCEGPCHPQWLYPHSPSAMRRYGQAYFQSQMAMAGDTSQSIIEVEGQLQFELPGMPVFPALTHEAILKPELSWQLQSSKSGKLNAELCYVSGGMSWEADYNLVAPGDGKARSYRLGDDGQPQRKELRKCPHQAHGGRREQDSAAGPG
jgi:hypothetical protein